MDPARKTKTLMRRGKNIDGKPPIKCKQMKKEINIFKNVTENRNLK